MATSAAPRKADKKQALYNGMLPTYGPGSPDYIDNKVKGVSDAAMINGNQIIQELERLNPTPQELDDYLMGRSPPPAQFIPDAGNSIYRTNTANSGQVMNDGTTAPAPNPGAQSNTLGKSASGQPLSFIDEIVNAVAATLGGTNFRDQQNVSYAPPRQPGGVFPGGMMVNSPPPPAVPTPNPALQATGAQIPLAQQFNQMLQPGLSPEAEMLLGMMEVPQEEQLTPPTPNAPAIKPPMPARGERVPTPSKSPKRVAEAKGKKSTKEGR